MLCIALTGSGTRHLHYRIWGENVYTTFTLQSLGRKRLVLALVKSILVKRILLVTSLNNEC